MNRNRIVGTLAAGLLLTGGVAYAAAAAAGGTAPSSADEHQASQVVYEVLATERKALGSPGTLASARTASAAPLASQTRLAALEASVNAELQPKLKGAAATDFAQRVASDVRSLRNSSIRSLGAGVDNFEVNATNPTDQNTVVIKGSVVEWSKVAQVQSNGSLIPANPHNKINFTATVSRSLPGAAWQLQTFTWDFDPASRP